MEQVGTFSIDGLIGWRFWHQLFVQNSIFSSSALQGSFYVRARPMRGDVTM